MPKPAVLVSYEKECSLKGKRLLINLTWLLIIAQAVELFFFFGFVFVQRLLVAWSAEE